MAVCYISKKKLAFECFAMRFSSAICSLQKQIDGTILLYYFISINGNLSLNLLRSEQQFEIPEPTELTCQPSNIAFEKLVRASNAEQLIINVIPILLCAFFQGILQCQLHDRVCYKVLIVWSQYKILLSAVQDIIITILKRLQKAPSDRGTQVESISEFLLS